jgi:hypothetical protein
MKGPVLRIRKGAVTYDDNQQEQAAPPRAPQRRTTTRTRAGGRRGRMAFLPLLVLVLALAVVFRVLPRTPTNRATIGGWSTTLRATPYQGELLVAVTFIKDGLPGVVSPAADGPQAAVRVLLPDTGEEISFGGVLSKSPITLRGQMTFTTRVKSVRAEVSVGAEKKTLRLSARARSR